MGPGSGGSGDEDGNAERKPGMLCLIQRVASASVKINSLKVSEIGPGLLVFVCAMETDTDQIAVKAAGKTARLRIFRDDAGRMNRSVLDAGGSMLIVSQFTLGADTARGNRPGFSLVANPELGRSLYARFIEEARKLCKDVKTGEFGAEMAVGLINDGPVTIWLDIK